MSVLDTFYTLFKTQGADKVKKDQEEIDKSSDKVEKGFKNSSKASEELGKSLSSLGRELRNTIGAGLSVAAVFHGLRNSLDYAVDLDFASQRLGVNTAELDAWGLAVQRVGGTAQGFQASLKSLAEHLGTNGETALKVLPQIADNFQKLGQVGANRYGSILGIDESTILLLRKGRREVESMIQTEKNLGVVTRQDAEAARKFNQDWQTATHSLRIAFMETVEAVLPMIDKLLTAIANSAQYLGQHKNAIVGALTAIGVAALIAGGRFTVIATAVTVLSSAIGALYEDLKAFRAGEDSLTGRVVGRFKKWNDNAQRERQHELHPNDPQFFPQAETKAPIASNNLTIPTNNPAVLQQIAKFQLHAASTNPLTAVPSGFATAAPRSGPVPVRDIRVSTGPITVNTQATDAPGIANAVGKSLDQHLRQAINNFDDGIQS